MTSKCSQQLSDRSVVWNSVGDGFDAYKAVASLSVSTELATQIHFGLFEVLLLVQAVLAGLPDIEQRIWNRRPISGKHEACYHNWLASSILADGGPHWQFRGTCPVEWAKDRALGCTIRQAMIDGVDQHRYTCDIGEQNKLLALLVAHMTGAGQKLNSRCPFVLG